MKLSIATKIFIGFAVVIVAFGGAATFTIYRMQVLRGSVTVIWRDLAPLTQRLRSLSSQLKAPERFLTMERPSYQQSLKHSLLGMAPFEELVKIERRLATMADAGGLNAEDATAIDAVRNALATFRTGGDLYAAVAGEALEGLESDAKTPSETVYERLVRLTVKRVNEGGLTRLSPEVRATKRALRRTNRVIIEALRELERPIEGLRERAESDQRSATLAVIVAAMVALAVSLIMLFVSQLTLKPLRQLREGVRRVAEGDLGAPVRVTSGDEIGQLAEEFNRMAAALRTRDRALAAQREDLIRAERLATIGKLAAQITHEVRNPLSSIGLNAELLEESVENDEEGRELLEAIQNEVQRVKMITEEYLRFARMPRPEPTTVDVGALIKTISGFVGHQLAQHGITAKLEARDAQEGGPAPLQADPDQLRQVMINIINNSIDALTADGASHDEAQQGVEPWIQIEVCEWPSDSHALMRLGDSSDSEDPIDDIEDRAEKKLGGGVRITVCDNGPGIDPEVAEHLFEPFVTGKSGGTGLGLALTQKIIGDHGGVIRAESPVENGRGTRFLIDLPRQSAFTERLTGGIKVGGES